MGNLADTVKLLKRDVLALLIAYKDPRTPWYARLMAALVAGYALSPIDLIPDFIPVLGYLDDLLIVPLGIYITVKLIPAHLMQEYRIKALLLDKAGKKSLIGVVIVLLVWLAAIFLVVWGITCAFSLYSLPDSFFHDILCCCCA